MDEKTLKDMWGALAFRGMVSILFGLAAVFWPGLTLVTLVYLFGAFIVVSGVANLIVGLTNMGHAESFWGRVILLLLGIAEVGVGVYLLRHPQVSFDTLILLIGLSLIVIGLAELFSGIFGGEGGPLYKTAMVVGGLAGVIVGIALLMQPASAGVAFVWILGLYALVTGPLLVALAFEAKNALKPRN